MVRATNVRVDEILKVLRQYHAEKIRYIDIEFYDEDNKVRLVPLQEPPEPEEQRDNLDDLIA